MNSGFHHDRERRLSGVHKIAVVWLVFLALIALLAPLIANDKPVYVKWKDHVFLPAISGKSVIQLTDENENIITADITDPAIIQLHWMETVMPLIPFHPSKSDLLNSGYIAPSGKQFKKTESGEITERTGSERHLLGTGKRGEDVLSGLIHGARISLTVGILSMIIAGFIGIVLGSVAGYFGDQGIKISRSGMITLVAGLIPAWFYAFGMRSETLELSLSSSPFAFAIQFIISLLLFSLIVTGFAFAGRLFHSAGWFKKQISFPADMLISRMMEIFSSLPRLILIISIAAIAKPSIINLILIIGFTSWTEIARLMRAEMLKTRSLDYIQSARGLGLRERRIIFRHGLPNAIAPALTAISFGVASSILVESGLTFLGIGVPHNITTWGSLLFAGKENFNAWWLVIFPGLAIFFTVSAFNLLGEHLRDKLDPRS